MTKHIDSTIEEWRAVPGWEELYLISNHGRLLSVRRKRIRRPGLAKGYYTYHLCRDGSVTVRGAHRLVMLAFVGRCPDGQQVNHIDFNPLNNRIDNLECITVLENIRYSNHRRIPNLARGEKQRCARLAEENVHEIRAALAKGDKAASIGRRYGVMGRVVIDIKNGTTWGWLPTM